MIPGRHAACGTPLVNLKREFNFQRCDQIDPKLATAVVRRELGELVSSARSRPTIVTMIVTSLQVASKRRPVRCQLYSTHQPRSQDRLDDRVVASIQTLEITLQYKSA